MCNLKFDHLFIIGRLSSSISARSRKLVSYIKCHLAHAHHSQRSIIIIFILNGTGWNQESETSIFISYTPLIPNSVNCKFGGTASHTLNFVQVIIFNFI